MLTSNPPTAPHAHRLKPAIRKPLQSINIFTTSSNQITKNPQNCPKNNTSILNDYREANKENCGVLASHVESIDASLAEELNAVREKMERVRLDREKTEKLLQERQKILDFQLYELEERGEFQRDLEIEVDRLFRLKQLRFVSERMSPIRSLREKEMEKKSHEGQFECAKTEESKEESVDESSTTESSSLKLQSTSLATSSSIDIDIDSIVKSVTDLAKIELRKCTG